MTSPAPVDLRRRLAMPGADARAHWRAVAKQTGVVREWVEDGRTRVCLEFWIHGKRRRIYSDVDRWGRRVELTRESASDLLEDIRAEIRQRRSIEEALSPFLGAMAPENAIGVRWKRFLEQKERESRDGRITARHLRELRGMESRGYLVPLLERSIFEIDFALLEDWLGWLADAKPDLSPKTRKHALGAVIGFARWLHRRREIREVPEAPAIRVPEHSPLLLAEHSRDAILEAIPEDARGVFLAMARMGLRPGEARALDARKLRDGFLMIDQASKDRRAEGEVSTTKTRTNRRLPCDPELAAWIETFVPAAARLAGGPMFVNPRGHTRSRRWSASAVERTWLRACTTAHGRAFPMYEGTRHSFATAALARGEERSRVQRFLGHTNSRTTDRYAKLADDALITVLRPRARKSE